MGREQRADNSSVLVNLNREIKTHPGREHPQHVLDDRPNVVRLPLIPRGIRGLEVGDGVHDILQPSREDLLLIPELGD